jgi:NAD(P)-dependent dehydrogenase (short-subunit alcohol dehydrogenase family)
LITGASRGIGAVTAVLAAQRGWDVAVNYTRDAAAAEAVAAQVRALGRRALVVQADVADEAAVLAMFKSVDAGLGALHGLVNNAGITRPAMIEKMTDQQWKDVIDVHLTGSFLVGQAAARQLVAQGEGGRIVNTTSVSGLLGNFGQANYAAAKAGIYGLTRTMSIELQKHRITVNAIAPIAKTRMTEDLPMFQGTETLGPEHIAPAALFLGSDLCGDRTGYVLAVAGARMYAFKLVETSGRFKEAGDGVWTAQEIADAWDGIVK